MPVTIPQNPVLPPGQDYAILRREGMSYIQQLGSALWTDYNIHDPGITILEALCYAITDLSYRASFDIKDLLAQPPSVLPDPRLQAFFTARDILTCNPLSIGDYRKQMLDIPGVRNAWLKPKACPPEDIYLYADCESSTLRYQPLTDVHPIIIRGLYDVSVAFEDEEGIGDLNSGKIRYNFNYPIGSGTQKSFATATLELRLPSWQAATDDTAQAAAFTALRSGKAHTRHVTVTKISGNKQSEDMTDIADADLLKGLRSPLFITASVDYKMKGGNGTLQLTDIPANIWFPNEAARKGLRVANIREALSDGGTGGPFARYMAKLAEAERVMGLVRETLQDHRNLCEDWAKISSVPVQDIAVCADIELAPDADIEAVLAEAYLLIDQYFSPPVAFHSLQEWLDAGRTTDEIFTGPQLDNGFIDDEHLEVTQLRTELRASDVMALVMDIPGVLAVRNFAFSPFDSEGRRQQPESWVYAVPDGYEARLYLDGSKWLVYKGGLTFLPDNSELSDSLQVLKGRATSLRHPTAANDLPVPIGTYRALDAYYPLQYTLPQTYGVSAAGLSANANDLRRGQAAQLKAYLAVYEQMLVNYLRTLSHVKDFLSLDEHVGQTYFSRLLRNEDIAGIEDIYKGSGTPLDSTALSVLTETDTTMLERRNRALDHLMARFGEQFTDYVLMVYNYSKSRQEGDAALIEDKIAFLRDFPAMSRNRARALNYKDAQHVCSVENVAGLQTRIARLLGFSLGRAYWEVYEEHDNDGIVYERRWRMRNTHGDIMLTGTHNYWSVSSHLANRRAKSDVDLVMQHIGNTADYVIHKAAKSYTVSLTDGGGKNIALHHRKFKDEAAAMKGRDEIIAWGATVVAGEQVLVIEHLLLRPHNRPGPGMPAGDALLPICIEPDCSLCGEEDPYSFRLTVVMNGETGIANAGIDARRFAEQTIRREVPAHLGVKICWVSTDSLQTLCKVYCDWSAELAKATPDALLLHNKHTALMALLANLKSVYPPASLHDCADGNDENRVYLNQTII